MTRNIDQAGAGLIAGCEGCYLFTYPDPATGGEPWTDGIGHTAAAGGRKPRPGGIITLQQAFAQFRADMQRYAAGVEAAIKISLPQHRFNAAVSFHFNTGAIKSGSVDDKLNRGDEAAALATMAKYVNAGGRRLEGLANRRRDEITLWKTGRYPSRGVLIRDRPGAQGRVIPVSAIPWDDAPAAPQPEITMDFPPIEVPPLPERRPRGNFLLELIIFIMRAFK